MEIRSIETTNPLISVIIPNFNYEQFICDSIDSVLNQTYPHIQLIVVDDGSTDDSWNVIKSYGECVDHVRTVNKGVSAARNLGLTFARGDFIAFLDSDDYWYPEKLAVQLDLIEKEHVDIVFSSVEICNINLEQQGEISAKLVSNFYRSYLKSPTSAIIPLACSNALIRSTALNPELKFAEDLSTSADIDFFRRLSKTSKIAKDDLVLVKYRRHSSSMSQKGFLNYYKDNMITVKRAFLEIQGFNPVFRFYWLLGLIHFFKGFISSHSKQFFLK